MGIPLAPTADCIQDSNNQIDKLTPAAAPRQLQRIKAAPRQRVLQSLRIQIGLCLLKIIIKLPIATIMIRNANTGRSLQGSPCLQGRHPRRPTGFRVYSNLIQHHS